MKFVKRPAATFRAWPTNGERRHLLQFAIMTTPLSKILDLTPAELTDWIVAHDWPKFRVGQLRRWLWLLRGLPCGLGVEIPTGQMASGSG